MSEYILIALGASVVSLLVGGMVGFSIASNRLHRLYEEVRGEIVRVKRVAEEKLATDEPGLDALLRDLNGSVEKTFRAAEALNTHEKMIARKTDAGKEITASSRFIVKMIDEIGGNEPEPEAIPRTIELTESDKTKKKSPPRLR